MTTALVPAALIALSFVALNAADEPLKKKPAPPAPPPAPPAPFPGTPSPPKLPPGTDADLVEIRDGVQHFRPGTASAVLEVLGAYQLVPMSAPLGFQAKAVYWRLVPPAGFGVGARQAALAARDAGHAVVASLSAALVTVPDVEKILVFVEPGSRGAVAAPGSAYAVVVDVGARPIPSPGPGPAPAPGPAWPVPSQPPSPPPAPWPAPQPGPAPRVETLPSDVQAEVNAALNDAEARPEALEDMAKELDASGYPQAAQQLRDRARAVRLEQDLGDKRRGGTPFRIRVAAGGVAADLPYNLAAHYTGSGARWKEIVPLNPGMRVGPDGNPTPWPPGGVVLLPVGWGVRRKPLPRPSGVPQAAPARPPSAQPAAEPKIEAGPAWDTFGVTQVSPEPTTISVQVPEISVEVPA